VANLFAPIGIDWVQEHVLRKGDQSNESNESAFEQYRDGKIADYIRNQYEKSTGHEFPIKEKKSHHGIHLH
jgi:hypothetical protein